MTGEYAARARHYAAEISLVPQPGTLASLLRPGLRIAEIPSGTGHFMRAYTAARAEIVLVDACPVMLEAARLHAGSLGLKPGLLCSPIQDLTPQAGPFDLIVMPNAALNQLAADTGAAGLLTAAVRPLRPGGTLLAQVLDPSADGACGFYNPSVSDGIWYADREFTDETGQSLVRRRRQHHHGDIVGIDFQLSQDGELLYHHHIRLRLLAVPDLKRALVSAGFTKVSVRPGTGGFLELLAVCSARSAR